MEAPNGDYNGINMDFNTSETPEIEIISNTTGDPTLDAIRDEYQKAIRQDTDMLQKPGLSEEQRQELLRVIESNKQNLAELIGNMD